MKVLSQITPPNIFKSLLHKCKKKFCPQKILIKFTSPPPAPPRPPLIQFLISFLKVLYQNKALHNFSKRGQDSIVKRNIGLEYSLSTIRKIFTSLFRTNQRNLVKLDRTRKVSYLLLHVLNCPCQNLIPGRETGHCLDSSLRFFQYFLISRQLVCQVCHTRY